jgi:hypothetical protein
LVLSAAWQPFTRQETELLDAVVAEGVEAPSQEVADLASSVKVGAGGQLGWCAHCAKAAHVHMPKCW